MVNEAATKDTFGQQLLKFVQETDVHSANRIQCLRGW